MIESVEAGAIIIEYCCVIAAAPPLSATFTVNVTDVGVDPVLHGFPKIAVDVFVVCVTVKPRHTEAREPGVGEIVADVTEKVYGSTPPVIEIGSSYAWPFEAPANPQVAFTPVGMGGLQPEVVNSGSGSTLMVVVCVVPVCAIEVAVSVTLSAVVVDGIVAGGRYETENFCWFTSVPHPFPEQSDPVSCQVTPALVTSSPSAAVKFSGVVVPTSIDSPVAGGRISMLVLTLPPWHPPSNAKPTHANPNAANLNRFMRPPRFASSICSIVRKSRANVSFGRATPPVSSQSLEYTPSCIRTRPSGDRGAIG